MCPVKPAYPADPAAGRSDLPVNGHHPFSPYLQAPDDSVPTPCAPRSFSAISAG